MKLKNFSNYEIYPEEGKVWSYKRNRFVGAQHPNGYWYVTLTDDDGKQKTSLLHKVIWTSVNGQIPEGLDVNHIDEDKSNNSISNLNLMTRKDNINWGSGIERRAEKQSKQVGAHQNGVLIMTFQSVSEAARYVGGGTSSITKCCRGKQKSHKGFIWRYTS